jgi:hypothetical protein
MRERMCATTSSLNLSDQAASFVPSQFDPRRTRARYTGHDIATIIAA